MANIINTHYPYMMKKKEVEHYYFYFEDVSGQENTISINSTGHSVTLYYSFNQIDWTLWGTTTSSSGLSYTINPNTKFYLKGNNTGFGDSTSTFHSFNSTGKVRLGGRISSILWDDDELHYDLSSKQHAFEGLFGYGFSKKENYPDLYFTKLGNECYTEMFKWGSTYERDGIILPAENLNTNCYLQMFYNNNKLDYIYWKNKNYAPSATYCREWLLGVNEDGVFYYHPDKTWEIPSRGASTIPATWAVLPWGETLQTFSGNVITETNCLLDNETETRLVRYDNALEVDKEIYFEPDENGDNSFFYTGNATMIYDGVRYPVVLENNIIKSIGEAIWDDLPESEK